MGTGWDLREGDKNWFLPGRGPKNFAQEGGREGGLLHKIFLCMGEGGVQNRFSPLATAAPPLGEGAKNFVSGEGSSLPPRAYV